MFGIPALSQLHLDVFVTLSDFVDVHLFMLNPCAEFTDDLIDLHQHERMALKSRDNSSGPHYYELGSPLLMSLGRMGLDFAAMLNHYGLLSSGLDELYVMPPGDTVLSCLHCDKIFVED